MCVFISFDRTSFTFLSKFKSGWTKMSTIIRISNEMHTNIRVFRDLSS